MPQTANPAEGTSAQTIEVAIFRQIFHWPLIPKTDDWDRGPWPEATVTPLRALFSPPGEGTPRDRRDAVQEFNYFHDFIQRFLYEGGQGDEEPAFTLHERGDIAEIVVQLADGAHRFTVERLTLHDFRSGPAIVTFEIAWVGREGPDAPLTLAETQTLIDHTRRSYTPYWTDDGLAGRAPRAVTLIDPKGSARRFETRQCSDAMFDAVAANPHDDAPIFEHWREIAGLVLNDGERCEWRDPSDERIPVMSFIGLAKPPDASARALMLSIRDNDWLRLADAEESGDSAPYNAAFSEDFAQNAFYDRFYPDEHQPEYMATRHIFGGAHYCVVGVTDPGHDQDFTRETLQTHFRRHYAQMGMMIRFEHASLLSFSSRITDAVRRLDASRDKAARNRFGEEIAGLHERFLLFVNRFRFTGVSSQVQGAEMFEKWRNSLGLDRLFEDVRAELTSTADFVAAERERRRAENGEKLNRIAQIVAAVALTIGIIATPLWGKFIGWLAGCSGEGCAFANSGLWELVMAGGLGIVLFAATVCVFRRRD